MCIEWQHHNARCNVTETVYVLLMAMYVGFQGLYSGSVKTVCVCVCFANRKPFHICCLPVFLTERPVLC